MSELDKMIEDEDEIQVNRLYRNDCGILKSFGDRPITGKEFKVTIRAEIAEQVRAAMEPKTEYGCNCELMPGEKPDVCVMDYGDYADCVYATKLHKEGKTKNNCSHWQPIVITKRK